MSPDRLGAIPANADRRAPALQAARLALKTAHRDVERRKQRYETRVCMGRALRKRALLAVYLVTGARLRAIVDLKRADFVRFYESGDHVGPAILLRPGKTLQHDLVRVKVLPEIVGDWIQEWIDYIGIDDEGDGPLWPASRGAARAIESNTVSLLIRTTLKPFVGGRNCSAHTLRHLCEKLAFQAGLDWLDRNRAKLLEDDSLSGMPASPQTFADALLDHAMPKVQDTYKDINSERGRETWARIAAEGVWDYIWGEKGALRGPDVDRILSARSTVAAAEKARSQAAHRLARLKAEKALLRQRAAGDASLDVKALIQVQFQTDDLADAIAEASIELAKAEHELERKQEELEAAEVSEVPLDDDVDLEALERELAAEAEAEEPAAPPSADAVLLFKDRVRDRVTPREFQWALGGEQFVADVTLRRYMRGQMPYPAGDRRNLWDPPVFGQLPDCILRPSPRKTWILIDKLDLTRLNSHVIERLRYLQTVDEEEVFAGEARAA